MNNNYYEKSKDKILEYQKGYQKRNYEINKDKLKESQKEYYEKNKQNIMTIMQRNKI